MRRRRVSASKLLIPLSYASQFGGVCTLIGTSINLLVNSLAVSAGLAGFGMFDFAPVGLMLVAEGTLYLMTIGWWLLPNRPPADAASDVYALREYMCAMSVPTASRLVGRTVQQAGFGASSESVLVELVRADWRMLAQPTLVIEAGDLLQLRGAVDALFELSRHGGLHLERDSLATGPALEGNGLQLVELIVAPMARASGRPLVALESPWISRAAVIAIARRDSVLHTALSTTPLLPGDALLMLVDASEMPALREDADFIVLSLRA